jgi:ribonuclease HI
MLIYQHNCRGVYTPTLGALEAGIERQAGIICLQEPLVQSNFTHPGYSLYWPGGEKRDQRVLIAVRKDLIGAIRVENRTDLVDTPYIQVLDIWENAIISGHAPRRTRIINCYDVWVGAGCRWQGASPRRRRAIEDANWGTILMGRCLIVGDFNAHSPIWNPEITQRKNAAPLEEVIDRYSLYVNNPPGEATRYKESPGVSIIDLALTTPSLGPLQAWEIDREKATGSDHELILLGWEALEEPPPEGTSREVTGWQIDALQANEDALKQATAAWASEAADHPPLSDDCTEADLAKEADWVQDTLTSILDRQAKAVRLCARSKRWWQPELRQARSLWAAIRKQWQAQACPRADFQAARATYHQAIRAAKRTCWETFLMGGPQKGSGTLNPQNPFTDDSSRGWLALRYTKPYSNATTPALRGPEPGATPATTLIEKEALIRKTAFPNAPRSRPPKELPGGQAHTLITPERVHQALFSQSTKKAPGTDRLNFGACRLLWTLDSPRIISMARQCFRLGAHPGAWKTAKGVLLRKQGKTDYTQIKAWRVISLLSCLGKVIEKLAAGLIADWCESQGVLHPGQMGGRRRRGAIDAVACLMQSVQEGWAQGHLTGAIFIDVLGAFDHIDPYKLGETMEALGVDYDLIRWTLSFLTDRQVSLVIDGYKTSEQPIASGLPQGSPASPILFLIYISGVFQAIERQVPGVQALSFADDIGMTAQGTSVSEICTQLEAAAEAAMAWGEANSVQFDPGKTEATLFSRATGKRLKDQILKARVQVAGTLVAFSPKPIRWLGILLDPKLTLRDHYKHRLQAGQNTEKRVRVLCRARGLPPNLAWRIQKATAQAVALFGAELWWQGQGDRLQGVQALINKQARAVTGMLRTSPIGPLIREAALEPAEALLDTKQRRYALRLLGLPPGQPVAEILPITIREGDTHAQPGEQPLEDRAWATPTRRGPWTLGMGLARRLREAMSIDPSSGFERTVCNDNRQIPLDFRVQAPETAIQAAIDPLSGIGCTDLYSDGSRLDDRRVGAAVAYKPPHGPWRTRLAPLGAGFEVFDAELVGVVEALEWALEEDLIGPIRVLLDAQAAINRLQHAEPGPGQTLALQAHDLARKLQATGRRVTIGWVPGHKGVPGNEEADKAAKKAAGRPSISKYLGISLAYARRSCTEAHRASRAAWLTKALTKRPKRTGQTYLPPRGRGWKLDPIAADAPKCLAQRYYQYKVGHAPIGAYLHQIKARESPVCLGCSRGTETVKHVLVSCRQWRHQRGKLYASLADAGVETPKESEQCPEARLFQDPKATKALVAFIGAIRDHEGSKQAADQANRADSWGIETLEEGDREGEG